MQLTYVFSELGNGLKRNVSMTLAVIVTIFVSLTRAQKNEIEQVLETNNEVASYRLQSKQEAYDKWKSAYVSDDDTERRVYESIRPSDMQESYWVRLEDPERFLSVKSQVEGLDGVNTVRDLREVLKPIYFWMNVMQWGALGVAAFLVLAAILQVGNTIRLAAFARRREIGIMRLVGASSLYIQLPFLLEALVAALLGVALASAALLAFMYFVIYQMLRPTSTIVAWVDWGDGLWAVGWIALIGLLLSMVPTLLMTRKYLKV